MLFKKLYRLFRQSVRQVTYLSIFWITLLHFTLSYALFDWVGETGLTADIVSYAYFWVVTASTVGYGDASPVTAHGKLIVALFFIPFSLMIFTLIFSKMGELISQKIRKTMTGQKNFFNAINHIVIVGYHAERTPKIIDMIFADQNREPKKVILVTTDDVEHPFSEMEDVAFCKLGSYTDELSLKRIALDKASRIIVDGHDDNESFSLSVHFSTKVQLDCHISTYIRDDAKAKTLRDLDARIEVCTPHIAEQLVRAMQDHGSSQVLDQTLTSGVGQTIYSAWYQTSRPMHFNALSQYLREKHKAILLGYAVDELAQTLVLNPDGDEVIPESCYLHYMANTRITTF